MPNRKPDLDDMQRLSSEISDPVLCKKLNQEYAEVKTQWDDVEGRGVGA